MHYLKKRIRDTLRDYSRAQDLADKCAAASRQARSAAQQGLGDTAQWLRDAIEWQEVAASQYATARRYRASYMQAVVEYETANASLIMIEGEYHQRIDGGTRRLYTSQRAEAIARAWADIFRD